MKPLIAVDVDGVLNRIPASWRHPGTPEAPWRDAMVTVDGLTYRVRHNPAHGRQLTELAASHGAELVWCTTWQDLANEHIAPLVGLPALPVVIPWREHMSSPAGQSKAKGLVAFAGMRPWVWFDDDAKSWDLAAAHEEMPSYAVTPHLLVQVNELSGLQDKHLQLASEWLRNLKTE